MKELQEGFLSKLRASPSKAKKVSRVSSDGLEAPTPNKERKAKDRLRDHQIRVLRCLNGSKGPLTRGKIARKLGVSATLVGKALGSDDPAKRKYMEEVNPHGDGGFPSLQTLGMVKRITVDVDDLEETAYSINAMGRKATYLTRTVELGEPKDTYNSVDAD